MNTKEPNEYSYELIQPWSVPVMKTTLPPDVLQTMIEISDLVITDKNPNTTTWGPLKFLHINLDILEQKKVMNFFLQATRQFVIACKCQMGGVRLHHNSMVSDKATVIQQEDWLTKMVAMWISPQQPGEYNPIHMHVNCQISAVMYLKVPKILPPKKEHIQDDGSINFISNASRDHDLCIPNIAISPQVGDLFIFGGQQLHSVYPFRCEEGDPERRSISFNAIFNSQTDEDARALAIMEHYKKDMIRNKKLDMELSEEIEKGKK
jgi:hypothetical protein